MGNAHPSVFPYEPLPTADNDLIVAAANDGQFRKLCAVLGIPEVADDPRFARNADRTANRAQLRPILVERLATRGALEWFDLLVEAGVPSGPINTIDGGFALAERFELDPVVQVGEGDRTTPSTRNPLRFSATPVRYGCRHPSSTSTAPSCARGCPPRRRASVADLDYPTALGAASPKTITLLGHDLAADVMGTVGFGELAFWLATQRRPEPGEVRVFEAVLAALADHGFTPTAIVTRLTYLSAPDSIQGALAAGLLGGGSRFLGVTEDCGRFLHAVLRGVAAAAGRSRLGRARPEHRHDAAGRRAVRARAGPSRAQGGRPAHTPTDADRPRGGSLRPAPGAVRGDRPGAPAGVGPHPAAERRRRLRRRAGRSGAAAGAAARVRAAGPDRGADRAAGRGAAAPGRQPDLPVGGRQQPLGRPRAVGIRARRTRDAGRGDRGGRRTAAVRGTAAARPPPRTG